MGLLALFLILFWVGVVTRHLIYKGHNDREVNRRLREQARHTPAPGEPLSPEQAEWFGRQQLMEDAELDVENAKTVAHLQRMARKGPGYAIAGNVVIGMAGYEMWRRHEQRVWDEDRESYGRYGFDA